MAASSSIIGVHCRLTLSLRLGVVEDTGGVEAGSSLGQARREQARPDREGGQVEAGHGRRREGEHFGYLLSSVDVLGYEKLVRG